MHLVMRLALRSAFPQRRRKNKIADSLVTSTSQQAVHHVLVNSTLKVALLVLPPQGATRRLYESMISSPFSLGFLLSFTCPSNSLTSYFLFPPISLWSRYYFHFLLWQVCPFHASIFVLPFHLMFLHLDWGAVG